MVEHFVARHEDEQSTAVVKIKLDFIVLVDVRETSGFHGSYVWV